MEFIGAADYRASKRSSSVSLQISAKGPADATAQDAEDAIREKIDTGENPEGWRIKLIDWRSPDAWTKFEKPLSQATIRVRKS